MPFPIAAAEAGISAVSAISSLFKGKPKNPTMPNFFVDNPDELRALITQSTESQYGDMGTKIRESLANAGVLSPSSFSDAMTKSQISLGSETLGKFSDVAIDELNRARAFQSQNYLTQIEQNFRASQTDSTNQLAALKDIGLGIGQIKGTPAEGDQAGNDTWMRIQRALKKKKPYDPGDWNDSGGGVPLGDTGVIRG